MQRWPFSRWCLAWLLSSLLGLLSFSAIANANTLVIRYPRPESADDKRADYPLKLLALSLQQPNRNVVLQPSPHPMPQSRALRQLANQQIDVMWTMTNREREQQFLPVRIPIYKGLIGWRIALIKTERQAEFSAMQDLAQLKALQLGQGHDWPDTAILMHHGFQVTSATNYHSLFKILHAGRIDFFPRSIVEIWGELYNQRHMNLAVEQSFALVYPTAFYFFVNKQNVALAKMIEQGLEQAIRDGRFEHLFWQYQRPWITKAQLEQRRIFRLNNPELPEATPLQRAELWFQAPATSAHD